MVVHIAPIGEHTEHVIEWLREITPVKKIHLLHSKTDTNLVKNAKKLEKRIKDDYPGVTVSRIIIENPWNLDDTMDAITQIIYDERENDVENYEIAINVTGGTNVMAAAAILAATRHGTKAYYVLNRRKNPNLESYVDQLPIPPIGIVKMNQTQQQVLQLIAGGKFVRLEQSKVQDTMTANWKKSTKEVYDDTITGSMTNIQLLKLMKLDKSIDYKGGRTIKKGATKIRAVVKELERKGYITIHKEIPALETTSLGGGRTTTKKISISQVMYNITRSGSRQARDAMMLEE